MPSNNEDEKYVPPPLWKRGLWKLWEMVQPSYLRLHWLYIVVSTLLGAVAIYFIEGDVALIDTFFVSASCISGTGLATVDITQWHWFSQAVMCVVMVVGSPVLMTLIPVYFRRRLFQAKFTKSQRHHLPEYRVLKSLFRIVVMYFVGNHVICTALLIIWAQYTPSAYQIFVANNKTTYQFGAFVTFTGFANAGFTTFPDNLMSFSHFAFPLLICAYLTLAGNTAFPIFMRMIVWCLYKTASRRNKPVYEHLLNHPRRYFTHMFLSRQTYWLFITLVIINSVQFFAFIILDWTSRAIDGFNPADKLLNSFFHSFVTRASGFNSIDISLLNPSMLLIYTAAMYISSTPVVVTVRTTDDDSNEVEEEIEDNKGEGENHEDQEEQLQIEVVSEPQSPAGPSPGSRPGHRRQSSKSGQEELADGSDEDEDHHRDEDEDEDLPHQHRRRARFEDGGDDDEVEVDRPIPQGIKILNSRQPALHLHPEPEPQQENFFETDFDSHFNTGFSPDGGQDGMSAPGGPPQDGLLDSHEGGTSDGADDQGPSIGRKHTSFNLLGMNTVGQKIKSEWDSSIGNRLADVWEAGKDSRVGQSITGAWGVLDEQVGQRIKNEWGTTIAPSLNHTGSRIKSEWDSTIAPTIGRAWEAGKDSRMGQTITGAWEVLDEQVGQRIKNEWDETIAPTVKKTWDVGVARPVKFIAKKTHLYRGQEEEEDDNQNPYTETMDDNLSIDGDGALLAMPKDTTQMRTQTKLLLTQDTVLLFSILVLILIFQENNIINDPHFTYFKVIFELASAYGTCGLSMGYPGYVSSFSSVFDLFPKLLIAFVMLMGRHRGLPTSIDSAIQIHISDDVKPLTPEQEAAMEQASRERDLSEKDRQKERRTRQKEEERKKKEAEANLKMGLREHQSARRRKEQSVEGDMDSSHLNGGKGDHGPSPANGHESTPIEMSTLTTPSPAPATALAAAQDETLIDFGSTSFHSENDLDF